MPEISTARKAVELRLAGIGYPQIAAQLDYPDAASAAGAVIAELGMTVETPEQARQQEVARLDAMLVSVWAKARKGDAAAVDRVLRLTARRGQLLGIKLDGDGDLRREFEASVAASATIKPVDSAIIEAGRKIADRIDDAIATCEGVELTKALFLMPHLVNILRELLATPQSRKLAGLSEEVVRGKLASLPPIDRASRSSA